MAVVRFLGNVVWFVLAGWWLALGYFLAAILMFLLIITIPFGVQALKLAGFALWPYGRTVIDDPAASDRQAASTVGNVLWILLAGWTLAVAHVFAGLALLVTIVGIPFAIASFKMVPLAIWPFGRTVVSLAEADRLHQPMLVQVAPISAR